MKKHIPNTITCLNLISGCIATYFAFKGYYQQALLFIVVGAVFDFFDGMSARLLGVSSPIGKELDSLADDITFGFAPDMGAFPGFRHRCLLGIAPSQVQPRRATGPGIHRSAHTGQRPVLGRADRKSELEDMV